MASNIAGNNELVVPGINGYLVPSGDVMALQNSLQFILSDQDMQRNMGIASRERVVQFYSWTSMADQYLKLIQEIVEHE